MAANRKKKLPTFIASRVGEILETTKIEKWKWVSTLENVAGICTRSSNKNDTYETWLNGKFLYCEETNWPKIIPEIPEIAI